jgi:ABC-type Zn uptake system ZnuABC Zn-binding protein ZnuA
MYLDEVVIFVDSIIADQIQEHEAKINEYQMQLSIQESSQSDTGAKSLSQELKKEFYANRELEENVEKKANAEGWAKLKEIDKKMKGQKK